MSKLIDEVKKNLPISDEGLEPFTTPVQEAMDILNSIDATDIPTGALTGAFGGADIVSFFGTDIPEVLDVRLGSGWMDVVFTLSATSSKIALSNEYIDFNFIGINEFGQGGLVSGECKPIDYEIKMGVDELSTNIRVHFGSKVKEIVGWVGGNRLDNITVRNKLNSLYEARVKKKGINNGKTEVRKGSGKPVRR